MEPDPPSVSMQVHETLHGPNFTYGTTPNCHDGKTETNPATSEEEAENVPVQGNNRALIFMNLLSRQIIKETKTI
jgi:hypothetical protein